MISIHAARVGCDYNGIVYYNYNIKDFNPRSPSGLRPLHTLIFFNASIFQSTQPEWAATLLPKAILTPSEDFNPRSPSGLRHHIAVAPEAAV